MQVTRLLSIAALGLAALSGAAQAEDSYRATAEYNTYSPSRAEVKADLALWHRAGLDALSSLDDSSYVFSADYAHRMAQYQQWRHGPEFRAEVQRLGGSVATSVSQN